MTDEVDYREMGESELEWVRDQIKNSETLDEIASMWAGVAACLLDHVEFLGERIAALESPSVAGGTPPGREGSNASK